MNCALFVDVSNLYHSVGKRFGGRKLDYQKLYERVSNMGVLKRAFAYGSQINVEAENFITALRKIGFDTKYKRPQLDADQKVVRKADWDVGITVDIVRIIDRVDLVVLCTSDSDMAPAAQYVKERGVKCVILASGIPQELKDVCDEFVEVDEGLLEHWGH